MNAVNLTGKLLVASPYLTDGNFLRSVVFILRHDDLGAFGLALDRPTARRFRELVELSTLSGPTESVMREDDQIYVGGPVDGPLLALHDLAGVGDPCGPQRAVSDGMSGGSDGHGKFVVHDLPANPWGSMSIELGNPPAWITGDEDHLRILHRRVDVRVRFIADYSGWGEGQLESELDAGGWLHCEAAADLVFGPADDLWQTCVQRCGQDIFGDVIPGMQSVSSIVN